VKTDSLALCQTVRFWGILVAFKKQKHVVTKNGIRLSSFKGEAGVTGRDIESTCLQDKEDEHDINYEDSMNFFVKKSR